MDNVKESFSKIVEWAKKHPWIAGGIVLLVIVIAWWVSKNVKGGGSSAGNVSSEDSGALQDLGGLGTIPNTSALTGLENSIGGGETVSPPSLSIPSMPALEASDYGIGGGGNYAPSAMYEVPTLSGNMETALDSGVTTPFVSAPVASALPTTSSGKQTKRAGASAVVTDITKPSYQPATNKKTGGASATVTNIYKPASQAATVKPSIITSIVNTVKKAVTPTKTAGASATVSLVSKTKLPTVNFTGWYNGKYYVNGVLSSGGSVSPAPKSNPLAKTTGAAGGTKKKGK